MIDGSISGFTRDRATWLLYLHMAAFGYFLYCFGPSVTLLGDDLGVSNAVAALHSTAYAAAGVLIALLGDRPMRRFGRGRTLWAGCVLLSVGVLAYCAAGTPAVSLSAALLCGFGAFLVVNVAGTALADHHGPIAGPSALSEANGLAAGVGMAAPLLIGVLDSSGAGWRWAMILVPALFGTLALAFARTPIPDLPRTTPTPPPVTGASGEASGSGGSPGSGGALGSPGPGELPGSGGSGTTHGSSTSPGSPESEASHRSGKSPGLGGSLGSGEPRGSGESPESGKSRGSLPPAYWWAWLLTVCSVAVEFSLSLWASTLLRDRTGMSESAAATAMTAVVAGLCLGRMVGGRLALRVALDRLYGGAVAVNLVGFALFWSATVPWLAYVGLFVSGLGMSVQFPLATAAAIRAAAGRTDLAVSRLAVATTLAAGGAPFLLGLATDLMPVRTAFLLLPILLIASIPLLHKTTHPKPRP
ncbi:MFS transporter [Embleya sp. NBC_00888]|uniref:MFS transporter n=1 Tax=Embleya sp. NBC_00888 TaxID=2975960 RepID=UPI0038647429|nr:MFS transporter [Embleya sp. NBC_00888]